ncbi:hypothetical protein GQ53DRAFT_725610 [Thozetella sp. PMI_491]|nr:hypothetical protein GQ53DRAFT_725610 [Thozetella sp. PMI_491]
MFLRPALLVSFLVLTKVVSGQDVTQTLPSCAAPCLLSAISNSPCGANDQPCLCADTVLQDTASSCILRQCSVRDSLVAKNVTQTTCGAPVRDESRSLITSTIALTVISKVLVGVRLAYRLYIAHGVSFVKPFNADDWAILVAACVGVGSNVVQIHGTLANGLGRDIWTLTPDQITRLDQFYYAIEILYIVELAISKLSIILFYLRIFPDPTVRRVLWGTLVLMIASAVTLVGLIAFQCMPIQYFWLQWDGEHEGRCLNSNWIAWGHAILNIVFDIWLLGIPLSHLRALKLSWKRKVGVALMFGVGAFVTVVSIIRLRALLIFANSTNPTWDNLSTSYWSTVEVDVGIICACMPVLRLVILRLFPRLRGNDPAHESRTIWPSSRPRDPEVTVISLEVSPPTRKSSMERIQCSEVNTPSTSATP